MDSPREWIRWLQSESVQLGKDRKDTSIFVYQLEFYIIFIALISQQFSEDEDEADEPLAPLPDEPDVDEDLDQDEVPEVVPDLTDVTDLTTQDDLSKPPSPKPQLSIIPHDSSELDVDQPEDVLDVSLKPLEESVDVGMDLEKDQAVDGIELDISGLDPDGLGLEVSHDLSQMGTDPLGGEQAMDQSISMDPFVESLE